MAKFLQLQSRGWRHGDARFTFKRLFGSTNFHDTLLSVFGPHAMRMTVEANFRTQNASQTQFYNPSLRRNKTEPCGIWYLMIKQDSITDVTPSRHKRSGKKLQQNAVIIGRGPMIQFLGPQMD